MTEFTFEVIFYWFPGHCGSCGSGNRDEKRNVQLGTSEGLKEESILHLRRIENAIDSPVRVRGIHLYPSPLEEISGQSIEALHLLHVIKVFEPVKPRKRSMTVILQLGEQRLACLFG